jgi:hypothetical protein
MSTLPTSLNKSQLREATKIITYSAELGPDYLARGLSALYRSARKTSQQDEILALALAYKVVSNPEFIICNRCAYI